MKRTNQFERTDRDITNALLRLMDQKPFEKITVQDIIDEALINRSTFYQHFSDKYAILERLQERLIGGLTERVDEIVAGGSRDFDKINAAFFDYCSDKLTTLSKITSVRSENLDMEGRMKTLFAGYIQKSGARLTELEAELLAGMMVSYFVGQIRRGGNMHDMSTELFKTWIDMSLFFLRLDNKPDAEKRLIGLIQELHGV